MGANYHSSFSTLTLWKPSDMNPIVGGLDAAITYNKTLIQCCGGDLEWDDTALHWSLDMKIVYANPEDGKMIVNVLEAGSLAIPANNIAYADLTTVSGATISATYVAFSTGSTALVPETRVILGAVNTALDFYPRDIIPSLEAMLNTAIGSSLVQHNVTATAYHVAPSTFSEDNIMVFSSVGLVKDSGKGISEITTHAIQHNIDSTADHVGTVTENNVIVGSSMGLYKDCGKAYTEFTTHAIQHSLDSTADHTGTITDDNIVLGSTDGLVKDSGRNLTEFMGARETTLTCSAEVTVDFSTAETQVLELTTDCTVKLSTAGITNGQVYRLRITQDGTGAWSLSWDATNTIYWRNSSVAPTITTAASKTDWLTFIRSASVWYADAAQNF